VTKPAPHPLLARLCWLSVAVGSLLFGPALLDCVAKPAVFLAAVSDSRPAGYDYFIAEATLTAKHHGVEWVSGVFDDTADDVILCGQYDPGYGYLRLAQHLGGDTDLETYAEAACHEWRDQYSIAGSGAVNGFHNYTDGLRLDWTVNANTTSRDAMNDQAVSVGYANPAVGMDQADPADELINEPLSREVAYALEGYINAEVYGGLSHVGKMEALVECILGDDGDDAVWLTTLDMPNGGHIEQWLGDYTTDANGDYVSGSTNFVSTNFAPFMGSLTIYALARHYDEAANIDGGMTPDTRTVAKVVRLLDAIWNEAWGTANDAPTNDSFYYRPDDFDGDESLNAADSNDADGRTWALNNMIAYCYWWAYKQTGDSRHLTRGDAIFAGGNNLDTLSNRAAITDPPAYYIPKEFNECLRRTIDGFDVRAAGVALHGE
jgi:hypothetical protein